MRALVDRILGIIPRMMHAWHARDVFTSNDHQKTDLPEHLNAHLRLLDAALDRKYRACV
jgi:hypothetical protein